MQRTGALLGFDNQRSICELLVEILDDEGYTARTTLDSPPPPAGRAQGGDEYLLCSDKR